MPVNPIDATDERTATNKPAKEEEKFQWESGLKILIGDNNDLAQNIRENSDLSDKIENEIKAVSSSIQIDIDCLENGPTIFKVTS